jgi:hypothetical protein
MALADITLADGQTSPVNHTFAYVGTVNNRIVRTELAAAPEEPISLTIAHSTGTKKGVTFRSHLLRVDTTILDTDEVTPHQANIRLMADVPNPVLTDALADDLAAYIRNWATSANVRAWLKMSVF